MIQDSRAIIENLSYINELVEKSNINLRKYKGLENIHVQSCYSNGREQLYKYDSDTGKKKYIKRDEISGYANIIQRDYEAAVNKKLISMQKILSRVIKELPKTELIEIMSIYDKQPVSKRNLIVPMIESNEEYIARWLEEHSGGKNSYPIDNGVYTAKGEYVRSKSEKILADLFEKYSIPYCYEPSFRLNNGNVVYPDFVILNVRLRKTIYWEHLGLIDREDYANRNFKKLDDYDMSGLELGDNLIITMESDARGFDSRRFERKIKKYCL